MINKYIGHRTTINNEQSSYRIVSYKRPRYDNVKQFKRENYRPDFYINMIDCISK